MNDEHEKEIAEELEKYGINYSLSSEVSSEFIEYERSITTLLDAYLTPIIKEYMEKVTKILGIEPFVMKSEGGLEKAKSVKSIDTIYSGPAGGAGESKHKDGASGVHVHMTNTKNTPIEVLENYYPLRVQKYKLRTESGGKGKKDGGEGIIRKIKTLNDAHLSIQSERRKYQPKGTKGGKNAKTGENIIIKQNNQKDEKYSSKFSKKIKKGESVLIKTPGGGGWGKPK